MCNSVTYTTHGRTITYTFDKAYECGYFANGYDQWVVPDTPGGTVRIVSITPNASNGRNGQMLNPVVQPGVNGAQQAFDSRSDRYSAGLGLSLPANLPGGSSVVKAASAASACGTNPRSYTEVWAVLTVLSTVPPNGGATVFRPPYVGSSKPLYSTNDLRLERLPSFDPSRISDHVGLADVERLFDPPHNTFMIPIYGQSANPCRYQNDYGGWVARDYSRRVVELIYYPMTSEKRDAVISVVQTGIDYSHSAAAGTDMNSGGGQGQFLKTIAALAATLLDNATLAAPVANIPNGDWHEDAHQYYSPAAGRALYGASASCGAKFYKDEFQLADGKQDYFNCCHWNSWLLTALLLNVIPEMNTPEVWNDPHFSDFMHRRYFEGLHCPATGAARPGQCSSLSQMGCSGGDVGLAARKNINTAYMVQAVNDSWDEFYNCEPNCPGAASAVDIGTSPSPSNGFAPVTMSLTATTVGQPNGAGETLCWDCNGDGVYGGAGDGSCTIADGSGAATAACPDAFAEGGHEFGVEWLTGGCTAGANCPTARTTFEVLGDSFRIGASAVPADSARSGYADTTYIHMGNAAAADGTIERIEAHFNECDGCEVVAFVAESCGGAGDWRVKHSFPPLPANDCSGSSCALQTWNAGVDFPATPVSTGDRLGYYVQCGRCSGNASSCRSDGECGSGQVCQKAACATADDQSDGVLSRAVVSGSGYLRTVGNVASAGVCTSYINNASIGESDQIRFTASPGQVMLEPPAAPILLP